MSNKNDINLKIKIYSNNYGTIICDYKNNKLLGIGSTHMKNLQFKCDNYNIKKIAAGSYHFLYLLENNTLYSFGYNSYGQCSFDMKYDDFILTPKKITFFDNLKNKSEKYIKDIYCSSNTSYVLLNDNTLYAFGYDVDENYIPQEIKLPDKMNVIHIYSSPSIPNIFILTNKLQLFSFLKNKFQKINVNIDNNQQIKTIFMITLSLFVIHFITKNAYNEYFPINDKHNYIEYTLPGYDMDNKYLNFTMNKLEKFSNYAEDDNFKKYGFLEKIVNSDGFDLEKIFYLTNKGVFIQRVPYKLNSNTDFKLINSLRDKIDTKLIELKFFKDKKIIDIVAFDKQLFALSKDGKVYGCGKLEDSSFVYNDGWTPPIILYEMK